MNQIYVDTVRLLLAIAPVVFRSPRFAMKGGTALNLFVQNMPRLSVDIDVVFTDHTLTRDEALNLISADLAAAKKSIVAMGYKAILPTTKSGEDVKLFIESHGVQVKVEVNFIFRGSVLPTQQTPLIAAAQDFFTTELVVPMLDTNELYGSKLVAAMDRQHPRDMFDVLKMVELIGWQPSIIDCFVAYIAGHNRPVHEVLFPRKLPLGPAFSNEFVGMTREPIHLSELENIQAHLIDELPRRLTQAHRDFLLSLVRAEPSWELMPCAHLQQLPAIQWKLLNLRKLKSRNRAGFDSQHALLSERFESISKQ